MEVGFCASLGNSMKPSSRYGPQTVNARMAFNAGHGSMDVGNVFSLFGPGVIFLFLRSLATLAETMLPPARNLHVLRKLSRNESLGNSS